MENTPNLCYQKIFLKYKKMLNFQYKKGFFDIKNQSIFQYMYG